MPLDLNIATESALEALRQHDRALTANNVVPTVDKGSSSLSTPFQANLQAAQNVGFIGVSDRWILTLKPAPGGGVLLSMRDINSRRALEIVREVSTDSELLQLIESWYEKISWWRSRLSLWRLRAGQRYRILQDFTDYYNTSFEAGTLMTFVEMNFVPYHGGYTVKFAEQNVYLQETENAEFIDNFDGYFDEIS